MIRHLETTAKRPMIADSLIEAYPLADLPLTSLFLLFFFLTGSLCVASFFLFETDSKNFASCLSSLVVDNGQELA